MYGVLTTVHVSGEICNDVQIRCQRCASAVCTIEPRWLAIVLVSCIRGIWCTYYYFAKDLFSPLWKRRLASCSPKEALLDPEQKLALL